MKLYPLLLLLFFLLSLSLFPKYCVCVDSCVKCTCLLLLTSRCWVPWGVFLLTSGCWVPWGVSLSPTLSLPLTSNIDRHVILLLDLYIYIFLFYFQFPSPSLYSTDLHIISYYINTYIHTWFLSLSLLLLSFLFSFIFALGQFVFFTMKKNKVPPS